jgi:DNA-binding transcriptional regulator YdaS (Cro superfamily)
MNHEALEEYAARRDRLRRLMFKANVGGTNHEIADYLGVHPRTFQRWLSGESKVPTSVLRALEALANQRAKA